MSVAGVGERMLGVTFYRSNFDGDYYGSVGMAHGCVIVKPGAKTKGRDLFDVAFVSPRNGKVYRDWESCGAAK